MDRQVEIASGGGMKLRKLGIGVVTTAVFAAGLWAGVGSAGWFSAEATIGLTSGLSASKEVPKPTGVNAGARGTFTAGLVRKGRGGTLSWRLTFRGLTGRAAAAHVHLGR